MHTRTHTCTQTGRTHRRATPHCSLHTAAGCNSPEFFASIIGIFVADSTVGVGTVIGSAPFNLCCITGGAALAMGGNLYLDPWLMGCAHTSAQRSG